MRKFKFISFFLLILFELFVISQTQGKKTKANIPAIWPVNGIIDKNFGPYIDPSTGEKKFNNGIHISARQGDNVRAAAEGYVKNIIQSKDGNFMVVIDHGNIYITRYGNLSEVKVKEKEFVKIGQIIGLLGKAANNEMPFLYYEIQKENEPVNPFEYILNLRKRK